MQRFDHRKRYVLVSWLYSDDEIGVSDVREVMRPAIRYHIPARYRDRVKIFWHRGDSGFYNDGGVIEAIYSPDVMYRLNEVTSHGCQG